MSERKIRLDQGENRMLRDLFESSEMVKVVDFLLDDPERVLNKSEIAEGADISSPTLYRLWERMMALRLLMHGGKEAGIDVYRLNAESILVRSLLKFDNELAKVMSQAGISTPEEVSLDEERVEGHLVSWAALLETVPSLPMVRAEEATAVLWSASIGEA